MKTLYESLLDDFEDLASKQDEELPITLRDCMDGHVLSSFMRHCLGPTHFKISEYSKSLKKKYKRVKPILEFSGKKLKNQVLGDIVAIVADQVKIDWSLDRIPRIQKALEDFKMKVEELKSPEMEKYKDIANFNKKEDIQNGYVRTEKYQLYFLNPTVSGQQNSYRTLMLALNYGSGAEYEWEDGQWQMIGDSQDGYHGVLYIKVLDNCPLLM